MALDDFLMTACGLVVQGGCAATIYKICNILQALLDQRCHGVGIVDSKLLYDHFVMHHNISVESGTRVSTMALLDVHLYFSRFWNVCVLIGSARCALTCL